MSEYQYYEFQAIDRSLTNAEREELRGISSRARITATGFVNVYNYGDLRVRPEALLERYFDAFCYVSNWGTRWLMFRIPDHLLDREQISLYCLDDIFSLRHRGNYLILSFDSETEDYEWEEGEGWLASMIALREDLIRGDHRCLYLAWLLGVQQELVDAEEMEPPVPRGLNNLTGALTAFIEFMRIDQDLVAAGARRSEETTEIPDDREIRAWIGKLAADEKDAVLLRLMTGSDPHLGNELYQRFLRSRQQGADTAAGPSRRTAGELLDLADTLAQERLEREAREQEIRDARRKEEQALARKKRLQEMAGREEELWPRVLSLVATKRPKDYDQAVSLLLDLRDLAREGNTLADFQARLGDLVREHHRKYSLMNRLKDAGLTA